MIKKFFLLSAIALIFASCGEETENSDSQNDTVIVSEVAEISLSDFDAKAGDFIGKEVKITGIIDHVCKHGGKKILLVDGDKSMHVYNDERFDEALSGSKVTLIGVVEEERIDSTSLAERLKHEEGSYGDDDNEADKERLEEMKGHIQIMMDSLKSEGVEYFSEFSLKYVSHEEETEEK